MSPKPQGVFQTMNLRQFFSLWDGVILSSKIYDMCWSNVTNTKLYMF